MIFLLTDDFHELSYLAFFRKLGKMSQNLLPAAVVIGALWVNSPTTLIRRTYAQAGLRLCCSQSKKIRASRGDTHVTQYLDGRMFYLRSRDPRFEHQWWHCVVSNIKVFYP